MRPNTAPIGTSAPSGARISDKTPAAGAGSSSVALSVSSSASGSSRATVSPGRLSQRATVASVTDSPRFGTLISVAMMELPSGGDGFCNKLRLFVQVSLEQPGGRRGGFETPDKARPFGRDGEPRKDPLDPLRDKVPGAHVARLFLAPHDLGPGIAQEDLAERGEREGIELLDPHQGDTPLAGFGARLQQVEIDLAGAQDDAADLVVGRKLLGFADDAMKAAARPQFGERGGHLLDAQQRFRSHQHQRLAEIAAHLAPQGMEVIGGGRQIADLQIVLGAQLQIAFEPRRGMFRPLPFVAVRQ